MEKIRATFSLPKGLTEQIKKEADGQGVSMSHYVRKVLEEKLRANANT